MRKLPYILFAATLVSAAIERHLSGYAAGLLTASAIILFLTRGRAA